MKTDVKNSDETLPRREREKLAHRHEIIDAATRIFAQKGFSNATLDEIAQEAEFSKGTIYLYFSNKEELLYSIIDEKTADYMKFLEDIFSGKVSFRQELLDYFRGFAEFAFNNIDFSNLLMSLHAQGFKTFSEENAKKLESAHEKVIKIVTNRARKARDDGELRDIPPEAVNGMIHGALDNMMMTRWGCHTLKELQNAIVVFIDILFNGIAKEKETSK